MPFRSLLALVVLSLLAACTGVPRGEPSADANGPDFEIVRRKEIYEFKEPLTDVRVVNRYGDLRIRTAKENALGVAAVIQRIGPRPQDPELRVVRSEGRIEFSIEMPEGPAEGEPDLRRGRIDLVVYVPQDAAIYAATEAGRLEIRRAYRSIRARTGSGRLVASSRGPLDLATRSGLVQAGQLRAAFSGESRVTSETGDIQLSLPDSEPWRLQAEGGAFALGPGWHEGAIPPPPGAGTSRWEVAFRGAGPVIAVRTAGAVMLSPVIELASDLEP